jgi:glycine dehydrogenase subunit 1
VDYIPNTDADRKEMLSLIGVKSVEELFKDIPARSLLKGELKLPAALSEPELLEELRLMSKRNANAGELVSFLGAGSYDHFVPSAVKHIARRAEFYTAYTPYQPEISQGMLQALYEYQTLICELAKMDVANASMYDGATALAEAISLACRHTGRKEILLSEGVHPEYKAVVATYGRFAGWKIVESPLSASGSLDPEKTKSMINKDTACFVLSQPNFFGCMEKDIEALSRAAHSNGSLFITSVDPVSLGVLKAPGEYGADVVTGEGAPLGSPRSFGGPALGIFAVKKELIRLIPGRLSGATVDSMGRRGFTLTLQTREQHIRREKASSNICSNEALLALAAAAYLSAMGKQGLKQVARSCIQKTNYAKEALGKLKGFSARFSSPVFKEFVLSCPIPAKEVNKALYRDNIVGGLALDRFYPKMKSDLLLCFTELTRKADIDRLAQALKEIK